jgi:hypothetical protein
VVYLFEVQNSKTKKVNNLKLGFTTMPKDKRKVLLKCGTGNTVKYDLIWSKENVSVKFETFLKHMFKLYIYPSAKLGCNGRIYSENEETYIDNEYMRNVDIEDLYQSFQFQNNIGG